MLRPSHALHTRPALWGGGGGSAGTAAENQPKTVLRGCKSQAQSWYGQQQVFTGMTLPRLDHSSWLTICRKRCRRQRSDGVNVKDKAVLRPTEVRCWSTASDVCVCARVLSGRRIQSANAGCDLRWSGRGGGGLVRGSGGLPKKRGGHAALCLNGERGMWDRGKSFPVESVVFLSAPGRAVGRGAVNLLLSIFSFKHSYMGR